MPTDLHYAPLVKVSRLGTYSPRSAGDKWQGLTQDRAAKIEVSMVPCLPLEGFFCILRGILLTGRSTVRKIGYFLSADSTFRHGVNYQLHDTPARISSPGVLPYFVCRQLLESLVLYVANR